jgi:hypothetical protein
MISTAEIGRCLLACISDHSQGLLVDHLNLMNVIKQGDFLLYELLHRVTKGHSAAEVFIISILDFAIDRGSSTLGKLSKELLGNLCSCSCHKNFLKVVFETEISYQPPFEEINDIRSPWSI